MNKMIISNKEVKEIKRDGIVYLDNDNNDRFIDFEECYQNYLKRPLSTEGVASFKSLNHKTDDDIADYAERVKKWREIAFRNVIGLDFIDGAMKSGRPYFEFHTEPVVRIEFDSRDEFWEMRNKIEGEFRWRTFDLT